jgi:predicted aconitase with swiveling domain
LLSKPLSLWGGFDPEKGTVVDVNHPDFGVVLSGRVLVMPGGRGSSSSSSVLLESARLGRNPAAIVLGERDPILAVGALVAADLYGVSIPIIRVPPGTLAAFGEAGSVRIVAEAGNVSVEPL